MLGSRLYLKSASSQQRQKQTYGEILLGNSSQITNSWITERHIWFYLRL